MEKTTSECCKRKTKILLTCLIIFCSISALLLIGVTIYLSPIVTTYKVEYIKGHNDVLVQMYYRGEKIFLPDNPSKHGYNFIGWSLDKDKNDWVTSELVVDKELTLYAKWEEKSYSFNFDFDKNVDVINISHNGRVFFGESLSFDIVLHEAVDDSNIEVVSTSGVVNIQKIEGVYNVTISDITADFSVAINNIKLNVFNVTFNNDNRINKINAEYGEVVDLPNLEKMGYVFVGYTDNQGNIYTDSLSVYNDIELTALWEIKKYKITMPKGDGKYIIYYNNEYLINSTIIKKDYLSSIEFEVLLSKAYNNSNYVVYALSNEKKIIPQIVNGKYVFTNINNDLVVFIENIVINTYNLIVDGRNYGKFSYGSFITLMDNKIIIFDEYNKITKTIDPLYEVEFGGWFLNNGDVLINTFIQDIETFNMVNIVGKYSRNIYVVTLVANGGYLENNQLIIFEGDEIILPNISKTNYKFAGWFVELVEKNTVVDVSASVKFDGVITSNLVLYAGWVL